MCKLLCILFQQTILDLSVWFLSPFVLLQFGKGIYFADMASKSANYCCASRAKNEGILLLCEVSLGTVSGA